MSINTVAGWIDTNVSSGLIHPAFKTFAVEDISCVILALRRVYNICSASLTVPHLIVTLFSLLPVALLFQCFQFINLYHSVFFPSLFALCLSPCQCVSCTSIFLFFLPSVVHSFSMFLFLSLFPSIFFTFLSFLLYPLVTLKNTKSRGSKHKSRRKSKKQKRSSTVCNSIT